LLTPRIPGPERSPDRSPDSGRGRYGAQARNAKEEELESRGSKKGGVIARIEILQWSGLNNG